ncbi:MAG TPA: UDP-N-acetylmuramoyl-L-alanine--D-glutamate ligase [Ilumatobacteraceae bacterium]|nr:UDP-N-acetylmuramoyl-L-alanine--D-glutamate ligase [Ilumatobacteraceae bacterium]
MTTTALIYGMAISGEAVARALHSRGARLLVADDSPNEAKAAAADALGAEFVGRPDDESLDALVAASDIVCPAPGVPETHRVIAAATRCGKPIRTEIDLAYQWEQERGGGPRPMLAVTGTDGKTTTTMMAAAMLQCAGLKAAAVGNTETPLIAALDTDVDAFVVECSSFRLNWIDHFRGEASVWLNLAPDHQNWHVSMQAYEQSKARMWRHNRPSDVAVGCATDPVVMRNLAVAVGRRCTFDGPAADYRLDGSTLMSPHGRIAERGAMTRDLPHDVSNALAAAAISIESGLATTAAVAEALTTFQHPPHRIEPIGEFAGARWYNDSKATTPHAAITAIRGFDRVVLLAGGRNKGLDLAGLADEHDRVKAVIALGEAAPIVRDAFAPWCEVVEAASMGDAVAAAARLASPGDTVLLSPACASFDWYPDGGYPARGDDFKRVVHAYFEQAGQ